MSLRGRARIRGRRAWSPAARGAWLLLVGLLLVAGSVASAHASEAAGHSHHEASATGVGAVLLVAAGLGLVAAVRRGRPAVSLALALFVGLFGLESAIHSVHHLSDPQAAASCALFSASQHAQGADVPTVVTGVPTWTSDPAPAIGHERTGPLQAIRRHEGRAPPVLPSA